MFCKMLKLLVCAIVALQLCSAGTENSDFFEVNVRRLLKNSQIKFGARVYTDVYGRYSDQIDQFGPVFQLVYWSAVWEVSGAGPAPSKADEEQMDAWVGSIYMIIREELDVMRNTSELLVNKNIFTVGAAASPPNSYYMTPFDIKRWRKKKEQYKDAERPEPDDEDDWIAIEEERKKEDITENYYMLLTESIPDFAKFWASSINYLHKLKMQFPFLELSFEPDTKSLKSVHFLPKDYATAVKLVRSEFQKRGIPDDKNKITGPGTSSAAAAKEYIEALVKDKEAYDVLGAWSFHVHDTGGSIEEIEKQLILFKQIIKTLVPKSWPEKPIIITEFSYKPSNNLIFEDVEFNGDLDKCYEKIHGILQKSNDDLPNTMAQSPKIGVRLLASLLLQYSHGFSQSIYKELYDPNWSHSCHGLYDRSNRIKQFHVVLSSFLKYIPEDATIVKKQWKNSDECVTAIIKSKSRLIVAIANTDGSSCTRSFSLSGMPTKKIAESFTVSYNNGTVSLVAETPAESLIIKQPLEYDVYIDEESVKQDELVEFDVLLSPHASVVAVINFTQQSSLKDSEKTKELNTIHTEL